MGRHGKGNRNDLTFYTLKVDLVRKVNCYVSNYLEAKMSMSENSVETWETRVGSAPR